MPDITMCTGEGCDKKKTCYRYKAAPNYYYQSYYQNPPIKDGECEHYWECKTKGESMKLDKENSL